MFQEGDEFARAKIIPEVEHSNDPDNGKLDHNSYNKDNSTNYLNYNFAKLNEDLKNYYSGLISLRSKYAAFRRANYEDITFYNENNNSFALGYKLEYMHDEFIVLFNADPNKQQEYNLPDGEWEVLVNPDKAGIEPLGVVSAKIEVQPSTGFVLKKK